MAEIEVADLPQPIPKIPDMTDKQPHPGGRPTLYRPEYCERVIEWGKEGKSKTWMAAKIDVVKETLDEWAKVNPEFSAALTRAVQHSQAYWEDKGHDNLATAGFQGNMWGRNMAARFPADWRETQRRENTGADGGPIVIQMPPGLEKL